MQNNNQKAIDALNELVEINNDRIAGYERASKETEDATLKNLFSSLAQTSHKCHDELAAEVKKMGGAPKEGTATSGKLYRVWMDVKAALTNKDRKTILSSCEMGEDFAVKAYEEAMQKTDDLHSEHEYLIKKQHALIKAEHDKVKNLRNQEIKV